MFCQQGSIPHFNLAESSGAKNGQSTVALTGSILHTNLAESSGAKDGQTAVAPTGSITHVNLAESSGAKNGQSAVAPTGSIPHANLAESSGAKDGQTAVAPTGSIPHVNLTESSGAKNGQIAFQTIGNTAHINLTPWIAKIFGANNGQTGVLTIGNIVQSYDFSKIDIKDNTRDNFLHTGLAPSFGTLTQESIKGLDEQLKIMIAGTNRELEKIPAEDRCWDKIISVLMQNPFVEPQDTPTANIARADKLIKTGSNFFKVNKEHDGSVAREVLSWFIKLIGDEDVLNSTKIDVKVFADIIATTGAAIDSFEPFPKIDHHEKTVLDIGVLRYPDIDHPDFKVYRIQLAVWSDTSANGITGQYNVRLFKPRVAVIEGMKVGTKKKAVQEAEAMFA